MSLSDSARTQTRASQVDQSQPTVVADAQPAEGAPGRNEAMAGRYALALARLSIGFVFLYAFLDKLFGLDHSTPSARSWLNGGSPTTGFLSGVDGPFAGFFNSMAGAAWADWLFMMGLLGIGGALMLGIGMRIAAATGTLLLVLMWMASLPITSNPFMDDHLIYAMVIVGAALLHLGDTLGFGGMWGRFNLVRRFPILR